MDIPQGFMRSTQSAASSETWIGPEEILQKREGRLWSAWDLRMKILKSIPDPQELLLAADCSYWIEDDCLWVRYKRYDLPGSPALDINRDSLEEYFRNSLEDVLATEELLRSASVQRDLLWDLYSQETGQTHFARALSDDFVRQCLQRLGADLQRDLPPSTPLVLSHSDCIAKNIILTREGYRLIDWEALGLYPASTTLSHAFSWTLLHLQEDRWETFLGEVLPRCLPQMMLSEKEALQSIYWQMAREVLIWSGSRERAREWIDKAERLPTSL